MATFLTFATKHHIVWHRFYPRYKKKLTQALLARSFVFISLADLYFVVSSFISQTTMLLPMLDLPHIVLIFFDEIFELLNVALNLF